MLAIPFQLDTFTNRSVHSHISHIPFYCTMLIDFNGGVTLSSRSLHGSITPSMNVHIKQALTFRNVFATFNVLRFSHLCRLRDCSSVCCDCLHFTKWRVSLNLFGGKTAVLFSVFESAARCVYQCFLVISVWCC